MTGKTGPNDLGCIDSWTGAPFYGLRNIRAIYGPVGLKFGTSSSDL